MVFQSYILPILLGIASSLIASLVVLTSKWFNRLVQLTGDLPSWEALYENDTEGKRLSGSLEQLIDAVDKGIPIKVKLHMVNESGLGERIEIFDAKILFAEKDEDNQLVTALNTDHISMTRAPKGEREFQSPAYHMFILANTRGVYSTARYFLDGKESFPKRMSRHMTWYGLIPPSQI